MLTSFFLLLLFLLFILFFLLLVFVAFSFAFYLGVFISGRGRTCQSHSEL